MKKIASILILFFGFSFVESMEDPHCYENKEEIILSDFLQDINEPEMLNNIACTLLLQSRLMEKAAEIKKNIDALFEMENERFEYAQNRTTTIHKVESIEFFQLVLQHPKLLKPLFISKEEAVESKKGWKHYPNINDLIERWIKNGNEEIQKIARILKIGIGEESLKNELVVKRENLKKEIFEFIVGKYSNLLVFCKKNLFEQGNYKYLIQLKDRYKAFDQTIGIKTYEQMYNAFSDVRELLTEYEQNKTDIFKIYEEVYTKLQDCVKNSRGNWQFLKSKEKVIHKKVVEGFYGVAFEYNQPLPKSLFQRSETVKKIETSESDDWLPPHIKAQIKKPKAGSKKAGVKKARPQKGAPKTQQKKKPEEKKPVVIYAEDGSFCLLESETDDYLEFEDPKNNLTTRILKTSRSEMNVTWQDHQIEATAQTDWVKQWYCEPELAIHEQGYADPTSQKFTRPENYWKTIAYHTPALILKSYLKRLAQEGTTENRRVPGQLDTVFTMPGIQFYKNYEVEPGKKWESGVFAWIIDGGDNKTNYHVEFRPTEVSKMAYDWLLKGYLEVNFPTLSEVDEYNKK